MWNGSKFVVLRLGPKEAIKNGTTLFTPNYGSPIEVQEVVRDLGVQMDFRFDFRDQRAAAAAKANAKAGWVLRTFNSRGIPLMRTLWRTLVQPHQDYASQLWAPVGLRRDIKLHEEPLRSFTKRMAGLRLLALLGTALFEWSLIYRETERTVPYNLRLENTYWESAKLWNQAGGEE